MEKPYELHILDTDVCRRMAERAEKHRREGKPIPDMVVKESAAGDVFPPTYHGQV